MRTKEEIQEELIHLSRYLERLREQPEKNAYKMVLTEMRIETLEWILNE